MSINLFKVLGCFLLVDSTFTNLNAKEISFSYDYTRIKCSDTYTFSDLTVLVDDTIKKIADTELESNGCNLSYDLFLEQIKDLLKSIYVKTKQGGHCV